MHWQKCLNHRKKKDKKGTINCIYQLQQQVKKQQQNNKIFPLQKYSDKKEWTTKSVRPDSKQR